jgi:hypothetical protein
MKLDIKAVAVAEALVVAAVFVICAFVVAVLPEQTAAATKYLFHIDLSTLVIPISWGGFFSGLLVSSIAMGLAGALWASIYNRFAH